MIRFTVKQTCRGVQRELTYVWLAPAPSGAAPPSPSAAAPGAPHTGGRSAGQRAHRPAAALSHAASAGSSAPVCALKSASGSLVPDLRQQDQDTLKLLQLLGNWDVFKMSCNIVNKNTGG